MLAAKPAPDPVLLPAASVGARKAAVKKNLPLPKPLCTPETCRVKACVNHHVERQPQALLKKLGPNQLFEDAEFPADVRSLWRDPKNPPQNPYTKRDLVDLDTVHWLRPAQFCPGAASLFVRGTSASDVVQGVLGDCWFISAMSVLATRKEYLKRLRAGSPEYTQRGLYCMAVFKDEYWHWIVVDDRVLCYESNSTPVFARCHDRNEFWVSLLEKVYAKVHGCYENLVAGFVDYGLKDLTGGVPEVANFTTSAGQEDLRNDVTWPKLLDLHQGGCLMGCAGASGRQGIVRGHAYALLDMRQIVANGAPVRLLCLRNPYGFGEWTGDWSDQDEERWTEEVQKELGYGQESSLQKNDGLFWMAWEDFFKHFSKVYVCRIFPHNWIGQHVHGEWKGRTAGGGPRGIDAKGQLTGEVNVGWLQNKQYHVEVAERTRAVITLSQPDMRLRGVMAYDVKIGFYVVRVAGGSVSAVKALTAANLVAKTSPEFWAGREVSVEVVLEAGHYKVIPMTMLPGQETRFTLVVWGDHDVELEGESHLPQPFAIQADLDPHIVALQEAPPPTAPGAARRAAKPAPTAGSPMGLRPATSVSHEAAVRRQAPAGQKRPAAAAPAWEERPAAAARHAAAEDAEGECALPPGSVDLAIHSGEYHASAVPEEEPERLIPAHLPPLAVKAIKAFQDLKADHQAAVRAQEALGQRVAALEATVQQRLAGLEDRVAAIAAAAAAERRAHAPAQAAPPSPRAGPREEQGPRPPPSPRAGQREEQGPRPVWAPQYPPFAPLPGSGYVPPPQRPAAGSPPPGPPRYAPAAGEPYYPPPRRPPPPFAVEGHPPPPPHEHEGHPPPHQYAFGLIHHPPPPPPPEFGALERRIAAIELTLFGRHL